jgi:apolipoprotein N-acyltransferase
MRRIMLGLSQEKLGFQQLTKVQGGFIPGTRRRVMTIPGAPHVLPLICYEVAFSGYIVPAGERPGWIVNVTNDGWFGNSTGPYQHLQMARLRAIEEGLPIVRSANTGISAVIDPVGREVGHLTLGQEGVLDSALPVALPPTVFSRWRHIPLAVLVVLATLVVLVRRRHTL